MAGARQHTIPQFLLRRFSSTQRGGKFNTWMYRRGSPGVELNIINVGVDKGLYGEELDDLITNKLEPDYTLLLDDLRGLGTRFGAPVADKRIPQMICHFCMRTRHLPQAAARLGLDMISRLRERLNTPEFMTAIVKQEAMKKRRDEIAKRGLGSEKVERASAARSVDLDQGLEDLAASVLPQMQESLRTQIGLINDVFPSAIKEAYRQSMLRNIEQSGRAENYSDLNWYVVSSVSPIILGDTVCVFETNGPRRFRPLDSADDELIRVLFPISRNQLLVGAHSTSAPMIDFKLVNKALARCSLEYFVSSVELPSASALVSGLGDWSGLLSGEEMATMLNGIEQDILDGRA